MIYQNIKNIINLQTESNYEDKILFIINNENNNISNLIEDIISIYIEYNKNEKITAMLENSFYEIFKSKKCNWNQFLDMSFYTNLNRTEKKQILELDLFKYFKIIEKPFHEFIFENMKKNDLKLLTFLHKGINHNVLTLIEYEKIWETYNIKNNSEYLNDILLCIRDFKQMEEICLKFNISPWQVVKKKDNIETFLATNVWQLENIYFKKFEKTSNIEYKINFYISNKEKWNNICTEKTSKIDFQSRIVFCCSNIKNEYHFNALLKKLNIDVINLNCLDYVISNNNKISLKEKLFKMGKIKTINKFEKNKTISNLEENLSQLITSIPAKPLLISNKKGFLKQWRKQTHIKSYENLLISVLKTKYKPYINSNYKIKCYFPIKHQYLDILDLKLDNYNHCLTFDSFISNVPLDSFYNLLTWLEDKNINWNIKFNDKHSLLTEIIISFMQFDNYKDIQFLLYKKNILLNQFKCLSNKDQQQLFLEVVNSWENIWTENKEKEFILTIEQTYRKEFVLLSLFKDLTSLININEVKYENNDFFENIKKIILSLEKFKNKCDNIDNILINLSFIELKTQLSTNKLNNNKPLKI